MATNYLKLLGFFLFLAFGAQAFADAERDAKRAAQIEYIHLKPGFIANYGGTGRLKFVKVDISVRCIGPDGTSLIRHHMPAIRHEIVMLISGESEDAMLTSVGKEELRKAALEKVREILMNEEGKQNVDDLLFNSFIVQQ